MLAKYAEIMQNFRKNKNFYAKYDFFRNQLHFDITII